MVQVWSTNPLNEAQNTSSSIRMEKSANRVSSCSRYVKWVQQDVVPTSTIIVANHNKGRAVQRSSLNCVLRRKLADIASYVTLSLDMKSATLESWGNGFNSGLPT